MHILPWKCGVRAFLHTLPPWISPQTRIPPSFWQANVSWTPFYRSIEIYTDSISRFARIFVSKSENEGRSLAKCCSSGSNRRTSFWLTEVHHVQWHGEIFVILDGVPSKQLWSLGKMEWFLLIIHTYLL